MRNTKLRERERERDARAHTHWPEWSENFEDILIILCIRKYVSLLSSSCHFSPVERRKQAPRSRSQVRNNTFKRTVRLYTLASSATSFRLWDYHQNSPSSHSTLDTYNSIWPILLYNFASLIWFYGRRDFFSNLVMRRRQHILGLLGSSRRRSLFVFWWIWWVGGSGGGGGFWRFLASRVGDHPQEDLAKTFLQVKAAFCFCDEFSPFGDNNSQKQIMSSIPFFKIELPKIEKKTLLEISMFLNIIQANSQDIKDFLFYFIFIAGL